MNGQVTQRFRGWKPDTRAGGSWWVMVPILLLTVWFAVRYMTYDLLWVDEVLTFHGSGGAQYGPLSIRDILHHAIYYDALWPPLYYSTVGVWGKFVGWTAFADRYLSMLFGCLVVALVFRFGRTFLSYSVGVFGALILSTSLFFTFYLHEFRGYTLHLLFVMLLLWFYARVSAGDRPAPRQQRLAFTLSIVGLLYSHSFGILLVASLGLYHLLFARRNAQWSTTVGLMIIGGLFFLPWFAIPTIAALIAEFQNPRTMSYPTLLEVSLKTLGNGLPLVLIALAIFGVLRVRHRSAGLLAFMLVSATVLTVALNVVFQFLFHIRHLLALMPLTALLLAATLVEIRRVLPLAAYAALALWIAAGVYHIEGKTFMEDQPGAIDTIRAAPFFEALNVITTQSSPEDAIFFQIGKGRDERFNEVVLDYHLDMTSLRYAQVMGVRHFKKDVIDLPYSDKFDDFVDGASQVWAMTMPGKYPDDDLAPFLAEIQARNYQYCGTVFANATFTVGAYRNDGCDNFQTTIRSN